MGALEKQLEEARREASIDALTGLMNRRAFEVMIRDLAGAAMNSGAPLALLAIDIDHFKMVNDTWGHPVGDAVLQLVARRLAHEIKNPLTPIQLSAERLERKLQGKLEAPEQQILAKSVKTIVDQVDAMKRLVNDFRDYARLPAAELEPVDLNDLIDGVLHLYESSAVPIRLELDESIPKVLGDPQQLRQVLHNLLQNALDATSQLAGDLLSQSPMPQTIQPEVVVRTQWMANSGRVRLAVLDLGGGFPEHILKRAFEPYVTTKRSGTGLGLAVVKKIADDHGARIEITNRMSDHLAIGAQVSLSLAGV
jgi:nitrogen fixation/metabolism regulation signal transduction histidine kinase